MTTPPHMPPDRCVKVPNRSMRRWSKQGGTEYESCIESGAIALVDAQWLIDLAEAGGVLAPRQYLPADAFLSLSEVQAVGPRNTVCVSHCWLQADHPDPRGFNLGLVASALKLLVKSHGVHAVFWDFLSLHQECRTADGTAKPHCSCRWPPPAVRQPFMIATAAIPGSSALWDGREPDDEGSDRLESLGLYPAEDELFRQALEKLGRLFSHPLTRVLLLSSLPPNYGDEASYGWRAHREPFEQRGWCYCEVSLAMLAKRRGERVLALTAAAASEAESASVLVQRCVATRAAARHAALLERADGACHSFAAGLSTLGTPPVTPASFAAKISGMSFSHPRDDMPLVEALYAAGFSERLAQVTKLDYTNLRWGDAEAEAVAAVLSSGAATSLKSLDLGANAISDKGAAATLSPS